MALLLKPMFGFWLLVALIVPRVSDAQITAELIEAAKKEGEVIFYGAMTVDSSKPSATYSRKIRHPGETLAWRRHRNH